MIYSLVATVGSKGISAVYKILNIEGVSYLVQNKQVAYFTKGMEERTSDNLLHKVDLLIPVRDRVDVESSEEVIVFEDIDNPNMCKFYLAGKENTVLVSEVRRDSALFEQLYPLIDQTGLSILRKSTAYLIRKEKGWLQNGR